MARFEKSKGITVCSFCGRKGPQMVRIKYARDSAKLRGSLVRQVVVCGPCGLLISRIFTGEECNKDRTRRYEKDIP